MSPLLIAALAATPLAAYFGIGFLLGRTTRLDPLPPATARPDRSTER